MKKFLLRVLIISCFIVADVRAGEFSSAGELKTLFTSISERQQLDQLRASGVYRKDRAPVAADKPVFSEPLKVEMRGILIKNGGRPVVWVNQGNTMHSVKIEEGIRVRPERADKASKKVPIQIYDRTYRMKPGKIWSESNGKVSDAYQVK